MVDTGDFGAVADSGFAGDASAAIPADVDTQIPTGVDTAALSGLADGDAAASDVTDEQVDDDPFAAERSEYEQRLTETERKWRANLQNLQSTKDREVSQYRTQAQQHEALAGAVINELRQAWVDAGFSEDDVRLRMDAIHGRTHSAMQQIAQASQSAESEYRAWAQGSAQRMANFVRQFSVDDDGNQLFDPNTDTVLHDLSRQYFDAARAMHAAATPQQRAAAEQQFYAIHSQHQAHVLSRREQALLGSKAAAPKQPSAQRQKQAREAQQQRGPQVTVAAGGAGPLTDQQIFDAAVAEAQAAGLDPDRDYDKVYSIYRMKRLEG